MPTPRKTPAPSILAASILALVAPTVSMAAITTWTGGGGDAKWSTSANWDNGAPTANDTLNFAGTTNLAPTNDLTGYAGFRIFFNSGAGNFTLGGNAITLYDFGGAAPKIENNSTGSTQTINLAVSMQGANNGQGDVEINPVDGNLIFGSQVTLLGSNVLAGTTALDIYGNNGNTVTFSGGIGGATAHKLIVKENSNVILGGTSNYTGNTEIDAGKVSLTGTMSSASNIFVGNGATGQGNNASFVLGTLTGAQTLSNAIQINPASTGLRTVGGENTSGTNTFPGNIALQANANLTAAAGGTVAFTTGVISGGFGLTKVGAGTVTLGGTNTYSGQTSITAGTLNIGAANNLGDASATNTLALSGGATLRTTATLDLGATRSIAIGTGGGTIATATTLITTVSGSLSGSGALTAAGGGTVILGADNSTYTGNVLVTSASGNSTNTTLRLTNANALTSGTVTVDPGLASAAGNGNALDVSGVSIGSGVNLLLNTVGTGNFRSSLLGSGTTSAFNGAIQVAGDGTAGLNASAGTLTVNGNVAPALAGFTGGLFVRGAGTGIMNGTINIGAGQLAKTDAGTWTINSTGNTWGATQIAVGTVKSGATDAFPVTTTVNLGQGDTNAASWDLNGFNQTVAGITHSVGASGVRQITNSAATFSTLTVNNSVADTYGTAALAILSGKLNLTKTGVGTLTLGGTNTYTGVNTFTAGTVSIGADANLGASGATVTLDGGKIITSAGITNTHAFTIGPSGGTIAVPGTAQYYFNTTNTLLGSGPLTLIGNGTLAVSAGNLRVAQTNTYSGNLILQQGGTFEYGVLNAIAGTATVTINNEGEFATQNAVSNPLAITVAGGTNSVLSFENGTTGNYAGPITLNANAIVALRDWYNYATVRGGIISGQITGSGGITVNSGTGTGGLLTLSNTNNTYAGGTTINAANVLFTNAGAIGGTGANLTVNTNGAAAVGFAIDQTFVDRIVTTSAGAAALGGVSSANNLDFTNFANLSLGATGTATYTGTLTPGSATYRLGGGGGTLTLPNQNALTGANSLVVQNLGTVALTNSNDLTGSTTINSGTLILSATNALATSNVTVNGGTLILGANSAVGTGNVTVTTGTLQIGQGGLTGSLGTGTLAVNGSLTINRGDQTYNFAVPITGSGTVVQASNNRTTLTGGNIPRLGFTGNGEVDVLTNATTIGVDGGVLIQVTAGVYGEVNATGGGSLKLNAANGDLGAIAGATLVVNAPITNGTASALDVFNSGGGTVVFNGANTYTGVTNIQNAVLVATSLNKITGGTASSSLGAPTTAANGTISFGSGTAGATLRYAGTGETTDRVINLIGTTGGATLEQAGTGVLGFSSAFTATGAGIKTLTLTGYSAGTGLISAPIVDNSGTNKTSLTKTGTGTWTLTGANTYTGTTTLSGGALSLDFSNATTATNIIAATSPLTLAAGTLSLTGKASTTNSQTFASTAINLGGTNISLSANATANPLLLTLGAITRAAGGTVNFTLSGTSSATNGVVTSTANGAGGILGGYATVGGTDWATKSSTNIVAYSAYTTMTAAGGGTAATTNFTFGGGTNTATTLTAAVTANSLKLTDSGTSTTGSLANGGFGVTIGAATVGGLMYVPATSGNVYTISGTGVVGAGTTNEFLVNVGNGGSLTISAPIISSTATAGSLTKSGNGTLTPTGASAWTGNINITAGTLAATLTNAATTPLGGQLGTTYRVINLANGAAFRTVASYNDNVPSATNTAFVFSFGAGGGTLDTPAAITLTLDDGIGAGTASTNAQLQGSGDLFKTGAGTLSLGNGTSDFSNFTGRIYVNAGTLTVGGTSGGVSPFGSISAGTYVASGATLLLNASNNTAAEPLQLTGIGTAAGVGALSNTSGSASYAGLITLVGGASVGGAGNITLNAPVIGAGPFTKVGAGIVTLGGNNSYTGGTAVSTGTLQLSKVAAVPASGAFTVAAATTLGVNAGGNGEFQPADMTSLLANTTFAANTAVFAVDTTNAIGGTANSAAISGGLTFAKVGTGTLVLPASTYTGGTVVANGTLQNSVDNALPTTTALTLGTTLSTGGTLDTNGFNQTVGSVSTVTATGTTANNILVGAGKTFTVNGNVLVGAVATAANQISRLNMSGGGNLVVTTAAGGSFRVGGNAGTNSNSEAATLDLTGLGSANINVSNSGTLGVANVQITNVVGNQATLLFPTPTVTAGTPVTTITAQNFNIGDSQGNNGGAGQVNSAVLGTGLTTINAGAVNIGTGVRDFGWLTYASGNGTLKLRAADGTGRAAVSVGGGSANTGVATGAGVTGNLFDLTGHSADLLINTLSVGGQNRNADRTDIFAFNTGTLDASTVVVGSLSGTANATVVNTTTAANLNLGGGTVTIGTGGLDIATANGTVTGTDVLNGVVNISGGTVTVANNTNFGAAIRLGQNSLANTLTTNGFLNVSGGTMTVNGNIIKGSSIAAGSATVNLTGGVLDMTGKTIGTSAAIVTFAPQAGTLQNLAEINGGGVAGALNKTGAGTLTIAGANAYTGATNVTAGTVIASGTLTGTSALNVNNGGTLLLSGSSESVKDTATVSVGGGATNSTLALGGTAQTETLGSLTLSTNSVIDFNVAASNNKLIFSSFTASGSGLSVNNWTGTTYDPLVTSDTGAFSQDRLLFNLTGSPDLTAFEGFANQLNFFDDSGNPLGSGHAIAYTGSGANYEIVPIPEPSTIYSGLAILGLVGLRERRRLRKLLGRAA